MRSCFNREPIMKTVPPKDDTIQANVTPLISNLRIKGRQATDNTKAAILPRNVARKFLMAIRRSLMNHMYPVTSERITNGISR